MSDAQFSLLRNDKRDEITFHIRQSRQVLPLRTSKFVAAYY